jgi:hypothetical protein
MRHDRAGKLSHLLGGHLTRRLSPSPARCLTLGEVIGDGGRGGGFLPTELSQSKPTIVDSQPKRESIHYHVVGAVQEIFAIRMLWNTSRS